MNEPYIRSLSLKNFRCFTSNKFNFDSPIVIIEGINGSGKTSLLEAIYFTCYMRSFRAHSPRDLIKFGSESFFITTVFNDHAINVGVLQTGSTTKRQVKIDHTTVTSHKELRQYCRVITITEDDLMLIKGGPEKRRSFIDHALFLLNLDALEIFKLYQDVLDNRNALLCKQTYDEQHIIFWTKKLWDLSKIIEENRKNLLTIITAQAIPLLKIFWPDYSISFEYNSKSGNSNSFEDFFNEHLSLFEKEKHYKRSLFGAHLDDIEITVNSKKARYFSSRGQQKLLVMVLKIALVEHLLETQGPTAFLLDDFTTDFDSTVSEKLMDICLKTKAQLIFVSPLYDGQESLFLEKKRALSLKVTI